MYYWPIGSKSQLSIENRLLLYKAILKPIWACGVQLWGTVFDSNIEMLQRFQNEYFRIIVTNDILHDDLNVPYVIKRLS